MKLFYDGSNSIKIHRFWGKFDPRGKFRGLWADRENGHSLAIYILNFFLWLIT